MYRLAARVASEVSAREQEYMRAGCLLPGAQWCTSMRCTFFKNSSTLMASAFSALSRLCTFSAVYTYTI